MYISSIFPYPCLLFMFLFPVCQYSNSLAAESQVNFLMLKWNMCGKADNVFLNIPALSITDCVLECTKRPRCKAVNFKGREFCELLQSDSNTDIALCGYIRKVDMVMNIIPCKGCSDEQTCDLSSGQCYSTECTRPVVVNGTLLGNVYSIGKTLGLRCDLGFREMNNVRSSVCLKTKIWSHTLYCVEESMTNTVTESLVTPVTESTTEPKTVPAAESTIEPTPVPATESTAEPTTVPAAESTIEPTPVPATESTTEPTVVPATESTIETTTAQATESTTETTTNPAKATFNCYSISAQATNEWCMNNCNHIPPYCPDGFCQCD